MKTPSSSSAIALLTLLVPLSVHAQSCSTLDNVKITFFGYPDNSPPGAGIAWTNCGHSLAGGIGTYEDPITFATATDGDFEVCDVVYLPYLRKYARYEDDFEQCKTDWDSSHEYHIDLWTGSTTTSGGDTQIDCENSLTGGGQTIVRNPGRDLPTDTEPFFSNENCNRKTYDVRSDGDVCSGDDGGESTPMTSVIATTLSTSTTRTGAGPTSCAWAGHCLGAACTTYDDCSDDLICTAGKCAPA